MKLTSQLLQKGGGAYWNVGPDSLGLAEMTRWPDCLRLAEMFMWPDGLGLDCQRYCLSLGPRGPIVGKFVSPSGTKRAVRSGEGL